ncbi:MAG: cytochrome ubiquinol oxidase subunit I [Planctomycetes bacterium]|jgi:cytochrome d ubiquinol oxidase subunit I|nr:cytochrome ubiquinol oxidase subunit I [Planctomycetota bacterium]
MDDVVLLSRIQFALTIMFHYLFPPLTIGMGIVMVYLEAMSYFTGKAIYAKAVNFWVKIFVLNFAIGVATGIVMEFEFGTNWATYSRFVGDVFGSALAAEGIFAFFLESGFLAVVAFGRGRVKPGFYLFSVLMVALGSIFSSVWIVVANSWQQTPAGHHIVPIMRDGQPWVVEGVTMMRAEITDFWAMVFNPSSMHRLIHVLLGCFITGAFFVMSISAYYVLRRRHLAFARRSFTGALVLATVCSLAIAFSGHLQAQNVYQTQPAKLATFEGHYQTGPGDLTLFGIPNPAEGRVDHAVAIPGGLSFLVHDDFSFSEPVVGLDKFAEEDRPPTWIPFITWRLMVGLGTFHIALTLLACFFWWRGTLFDKRWLMAVFVVAFLGAVVANQAGWIAAEVGRQPWIVHPPIAWHDDGSIVTGADGKVDYDETLGLRTTDGVSKAIASEQVLGSIIMFGLIYGLLFVVWVVVLNHKIHDGPEEIDEEADLRGERATGGLRGFVAAAIDRAGHRQSMTEAHGKGGEE